jgi:PKD repeat protein
VNLPVTTSTGSTYVWSNGLAVDGSIQVLSGGASLATAAFTFNPPSGLAPLAVTFHNTAIGVFTNAVWDYGDGVVETNLSLTVNHTYTVAPSTNTVSLTVTDTYGSMSIFTVSNAVVVTLPAANTPPRITSIKSSGGNVTIIGTNSLTAAGHVYYLMSSTNVTVPSTNWSSLATNNFAADGGFTNTVSQSGAKEFYLISVPQP